MADPASLPGMLEEAVPMLVEATGLSPIDFFHEVDQLAIAATPDARYALGLIEGAAVVAGMTPLELLDRFGMTRLRPTMLRTTRLRRRR